MRRKAEIHAKWHRREERERLGPPPAAAKPEPVEPAAAEPVEPEPIPPPTPETAPTPTTPTESPEVSTQVTLDRPDEPGA